MPTVPTYDNLRVATSDAPMPGFQPASGPSAGQIAGQQLQQLGAGLESAGGVAGKIAADMQQQANDLRVNDAMNQYMTAQTNARVEVLKLKGKDALERPDNKSLPDEYGEKMDQIVSDLGGKLGNAAQRQSFNAAAQRQGIQFRGAVSQHMVQQAEVYADQTDKAALDTAVNRGTLLWGDKEALDGSRAAITRAVDAIAKRKGMGTEARDMALIESMTPLHMGVMKSMITAGQASEAKRYYDENLAGMTLQGRAQMQGIVKQASDVQAGEGAAESVWGATGPHGMNDAVKIFDMERDLRAKLKDNPDAMKHGIDALRQRASAFNAQQAETNAENKNKVWALLDQRMPTGQMMRTDAWLALPATEQHAILKTRDREAHEAESRQFTLEQRQALAGQRADHALLNQNGDAYLRYTDPQALADMTRREVEATRTVFGREGAQHLLQRWDTLQKPGKIAEARMDKQDFEHVAQQMGLDPFNAKTPAAKQRLGELQFRVEQLINTAQDKKGATLDRSEKMALMTGELARGVTVNGFFSNDTVPVIQLDAQQAQKVIVPPADRTKISEALATGYAREPNNPLYAPTEANMRRLYLRSRSRAADLIPEAK